MNHQHHHNKDPDSDAASGDDTPTTLDGWRYRPASFVFIDAWRTMLVWDTEDGSGIVTKHGIGKMPVKYAESVISVLMEEIERLTTATATTTTSTKRLGKRMREV